MAAIRFCALFVCFVHPYRNPTVIYNTVPIFKYGGNPVSCAVCLAVFDVLEKENLLKNAEIVGLYALDRFRQLGKAHPWVIGDVRGAGLFLGIDLVDDRVSRAPAGKEFVKQILLRMKRRKVLLSSEGPFGNIIKVKPPMCFTKENVDQVKKNRRAL